MLPTLKNLTEALPEDQALIEGWTTNIINALKGQPNGLAPLDVNGIVPSANLPSMSLTWGSITGTLSDQTDLITALGAKASTDSPAFSGVPTAPNAIAGTNTLQLATTAFVKQAIENTTLVWTPNAPTQATSDNSTKVASTAFVQANLSPLKTVSAGAYKFFHTSSIKTTTSTTYVKVFEFKVNFGGSCRIKFGLKSSTGLKWAYARIYINGVAVGTERQTWNSVYDYFSEDISGINTGDLIQIYAMAQSGYTTYVTDVSFASVSPAIIGEAI